MNPFTPFISTFSSRLRAAAHTAAFAAMLGTGHAAINTDFEVFPADVNLKSSRDKQSLVVRMTEANGVHRDVTGEAKFTVVDPSKAKIEKGIVLPLADGNTQVKIEWKGKTAEVAVKVEEATVEQPISFRLDVMPVFMKAECNRCHGAARGQDGFRLSLWGFDPEGDHYRLTRELSGRRINLAIPEDSMLLTKSTGEAPHTGGKLFEKGSELANTFQRWLEAGAPNDPPTVPTVTRLEILPKQLLLESPGQNFKMSVRAFYSDGTDRDVSTLALFLTSNESSAKVANDGTITTGQRGEAFVMARFATFTVGSQVIVIPKALEYQWPPVEERNFVDVLVDQKLRNLRITPSEVCNDETFLRRAFLDITGTLPSADQVRQFVADPSSTKRAGKIDELLQRSEFVDMWAMKWSELLQVRTEQNNGSYKATLTYYTWLREQLGKNVPINEIARELLSASGSTLENPAANYYQLEQDPLKLAEDTAQAFFGIRIQCSQCHNHPFDRWTMADYRGFVAFFTQIGRKAGEDPRERILFNSGSGESKHPIGDTVVPPKFLGGEAPDTKNKDRRKVLADWIASPENPYFPRHIANLIWAQYMGRGIVEPVDDVRISNPASNPELLEALGKKIVEYNYDLRRIVRDICNSRTYQLTTRPNESNELDSRNFAHATIRRMRAEVMFDCITQVTDTRNKFRGLPSGARAVEIADGKTSNYFLTTFGRATRETLCSREEVGPTLSQALHLINGDTIENKIVQGGLITKLLNDKKTPRDLVTELYLRSFGRFPTEEELIHLEPNWGVTEQQPAVFTDIFWALLNAKEFIFNH
ncbi:MAG: hypothetical protein JWL90_761 [Chthoniobacteraceae bacterium]|nr:hypothetical protein [Chthoniobacteraceae bacterium]